MVRQAAEISVRFAPVENITLNERVYRRLRDALISGRFMAGEFVSLRPLAEELGTSVMPVREAVHRLATQQALEILPNRSIRVPILSLERFDQLCAMRKLIEGEAAAQAAQNITANGLAQLKTINAEIESAIEIGDRDAIFAANREFHFTLYGFANNEFMHSMVETCWLTAGPYLAAIARYEPERTGRRKVGLTQHAQLIAALAIRDREKARRAVIDDIAEAEGVVRQHLSTTRAADLGDDDVAKPRASRRPRRT